MKFIADLHIHSKYARATSPNMNLENLDVWAHKKGIDVISASDFTHPEWFKELSEKLEESEQGLYKLKGSTLPTRFILTTEVSCIYSKNDRVRRIHLLIFAPSLAVVAKINAQLGIRGKLASDGRPILGMDAKEVLKIALDASPECMIVPAHAWTPWFSIFGSKSGFDTIEECFDEYTKYITAIETGLSSDPAMNWRLSALDDINLISNSDSHSLAKIGREANIFDTEKTYKGISDVLKKKDNKKFLFTIEFFPEEGRYHYDGHRLCKLSFAPAESKKLNNICPTCKKPLVIGVLNRVGELADRKEGEKPENAVPFKPLIPLQEIIAEAFSVGVSTKRTQEEYEKVVSSLKNEFYVLLNATSGELKDVASPEVVEGIMRVREGKVRIEPGYDGEYGKISIFNDGEQREDITQKSLF
ncbi:MAG TPA: DNA helicase UvrD [candidate division CPR3 bacterium]|uniref:DNA helicase UvrD n=1 Tax=candidate division CPR3 bacterium TaxID=2268181 RepID=A0A7C1P5P7_UNCC3|nr:DNA helicase UvrD [candidate division CPR3 bacterium]